MSNSTNSNNDYLTHKIYPLLKEWLKDRSIGLCQSVKQLNQETIYVDILQRFVDCGNLQILDSFAIELQINCHDDTDNFSITEDSQV
jgi:hypothetical protein